MKRPVLHTRQLRRRARLCQPQRIDPFVVRPATWSDAGLLVEFNRALARETEGLELEPDVLARGVRAALADPAKGEYRICELDGAACASLLITREWSDWRCGWAWWIQSVYVAPAVRRRGTYRALHTSVLNDARRCGAKAVRLYVERSNAAAQRTYERVGMARSHYELFEFGDSLHP